ncbi:MAG: hypothetical protein PHC61_11495, partial [Chitinivibrionales bacterium]|nr:hypothetical protein [Chitinivibrionales bacterium]
MRFAKNTATKLLFITAILLLAGCASQYQIIREQNTFLRRMPQINRVDAGKPLQKGSFAASLSGSYAVAPPGVMVATDSSFETHSSLFGDQITVVTSSQSFCYETRTMLSGDGMYEYNDFMALGLSLDLSLGNISSPLPATGKMLHDDGIEGSIFLRFAKQFGPIAVAIRPELVLAHLYGDQITAESSAVSGPPLTSTQQISDYVLSVRSSSVIRFDISEPLSVFCAITVKSQPYPTSDANLDHEVAYGIYGGCDLQYLDLSLVPYVTVPLGSSVSHFKSP